MTQVKYYIYKENNTRLFRFSAKVVCDRMVKVDLGRLTSGLWIFLVRMLFGWCYSGAQYNAWRGTWGLPLSGKDCCPHMALTFCVSFICSPNFRIKNDLVRQLVHLVYNCNDCFTSLNYIFLHKVLHIEKGQHHLERVTLLQGKTRQTHVMVEYH